MGVEVLGNVEKTKAWALRLEEVMVMVDGALLLVGEIQYGGGFSRDEFRHGF